MNALDPVNVATLGSSAVLAVIAYLCVRAGIDLMNKALTQQAAMIDLLGRIIAERDHAVPAALGTRVTTSNTNANQEIAAATSQSDGAPSH